MTTHTVTKKNTNYKKEEKSFILSTNTRTGRHRAFVLSHTSASTNKTSNLHRNHGTVVQK